MFLSKSTSNLKLISTFWCRFSNFVPNSNLVSDSDVDALKRFIDQTRSLVVLTGAGISTESGIPDYRSEKVGLYARNGHKPTNYHEFIKSPHSRTRYWARSFIAWPQFSQFKPNFNHEILKRWEDKGLVDWVVTQNVDSLHLKAGNKNLIELHGSLYSVVCMGCGQRESRESVQTTMATLNRHWHVINTYEPAPDGDVALDDHFVYDFQVPSCSLCGGILKPDVVLFGENVPRLTLDRTLKLFHHCDSVLVLGSSLHVYSGFRFILKSKEEGKRVAVVNIGETRADSLVDLKIDAKCSHVLKKIDV